MLPKVDSESERVTELTDRLKEQEREIERLTAQIEVLTAGIGVLKNTGAEVKTVPVKKLVPPTPEEEEESQESDPLASGDEQPVPKALEGKSIADSTFETMQIYYRGLQQIEARDYDGALASFREFLNLDPENVYADRARYWIGEANFLANEFGLAIVESNLLESKHPQSFRLPDSLMMRALAYEQGNQPRLAIDTLRDLTKRFPKLLLFERASKKLAEMSLKNKTRSDSSADSSSP